MSTSALRALSPSATSSWSVWSTTAQVTVTDASRLDEATRIVRDTLDAIGAACSRFDPESELSRFHASARPETRVSPLLAELVAIGLDIARLTGGSVDPTLGNDLDALGYRTDLAHLDLTVDPVTAEARPTLFVERRAGWKRVSLRGRTLSVPGDLRLDLGASAKAHAADLAAKLVADRLRVGVLVSLGGDIATAGPSSGWEVLVRDRPDDPAQQIRLSSGWALATSSTQKRRWHDGVAVRQHILDPRFGMPAPAVWRSVSVVAPTCLWANACSTAAVVRGAEAPAWLVSKGVAARLVRADGGLVAVGGWPEESGATTRG